MSTTFFQAPVCDSEGAKCLANIKINEAWCLKSCQGLVVTSFVKSSNESRIFFTDSKQLMKVKEQYDKYKIVTPIKNSKLKGLVKVAMLLVILPF